MKQATNINVQMQYLLNDESQKDTDLYKVVVQKGNVGSKYVYALQLLHSQHNIYVFRGLREEKVQFDKSNPVLRLIGQDNDGTLHTAGGHTQTWEYANRSNEWFVGTKYISASHFWTKQIARVHIPITNKVTNNTDLPRLSYLNYAGGMGYSGDDMQRVEAAVSSNYKYFMIVSGDTAGNAYFSLYDLNLINERLDAAGTSPVDIRTIDYISSFEIPQITDMSKVGSLQGFDISDDGKFVYISSQYSPTSGDHGETRKIVKVPWKSTDPSYWEEVNLKYNSELDAVNEYGNKYLTEFEGIQLINDNDLYLTVAYHDPNADPVNQTTMNRIYRVSWTSSLN